MSVSATFGSATISKKPSSPAKCQKCHSNLATTRTHGDYCTECFLIANNKRFSYTLGRAGLRKFEKILVPFDGDIQSYIVIKHLKDYDAFVTPFPYDAQHADVISQNNNKLAVTALDISDIQQTRQAKKAAKAALKEAALVAATTSATASATTTDNTTPSENVPANSPHITDFSTFPSPELSQPLFAPADAALFESSFPVNVSELHSNSFPFNAAIPVRDSAQRANADLLRLSRLFDASALHQADNNPRSSLHYRCTFTHIDAVRINTLLATQGQELYPQCISTDPVTSSSTTNAKITPLMHQSLLRTVLTPFIPQSETSTNNIVYDTTKTVVLPTAYPAVQLFDVMEPTAISQRVLPYCYSSTLSETTTTTTTTTTTPHVFGSKLLTQATTIPVLVVPLEHSIPLTFITSNDMEKGRAYLTKMLSLPNIGLSYQDINISYYETLFARSFALYRLLVQNNSSTKDVIQWTKNHPSFFNSIVDIVQLLRRRMLAQIAAVFQLRAVIAPNTVEHVTKEILSGLTKGRADTWLSGLVQWSSPINVPSTIIASQQQQQLTTPTTSTQTDSSPNTQSSAFTDISRVDEIALVTKTTPRQLFPEFAHIASDVQLAYQIPFINLFYEASDKILALHYYFHQAIDITATLTTNNRSKSSSIILAATEHFKTSTSCGHFPLVPSLQCLFWLHREYINAAGAAGALFTKNSDVITANFLQVLSVVNPSAVSNVLKTCDKLVPRMPLQHFHAKYTSNTSSQQIYQRAQSRALQQRYDKHQNNARQAAADAVRQKKQQELQQTSQQSEQLSQSDTQTNVSTIAVSPSVAKLTDSAALWNNVAVPTSISEFFLPDEAATLSAIEQQQQQKHQANIPDDDFEEDTPSCGTPQQPVNAKKSSLTSPQFSAYPVLLYDNASDGWYGTRCACCGGICPDPVSLPQLPSPPINLALALSSSTPQFTSDGLCVNTEKPPQLVCSHCQLLITDCSSASPWLLQAVQQE